MIRAMNETTDIEYVCTVVVQVNTETGEVERVNVDDEGISLAAHEDPESPAVKIAAEKGWPAWQFGF